MAKRKSRTLVSDLPPELAELAELAEVAAREAEKEERKPARKVQRVGKGGRDRAGYLSELEEKWNARRDVCKEWKQTKGRFPKNNKKDKEENSLYAWLKDCKPGAKSWTKARWEKLNEAFKEGWEKECFPYLETGGFQPGHQHNPRDEAQWDAILEAVKLFKQTHGRFPKGSGDKDERRLYDWLKGNMDTTSTYYTHERANKLVLAFGDRWQSECFPKSIWAW